MARRALLALTLLIACAAPLGAQPAPQPDTNAPDPNTEAQPSEGTPEPTPPPAPRTMIGSWEFSNADREKICTITFQADANKIGKRLQFNAGCAENFPFTRDIVAWSQSGNDFLRLLDAQGQSVLEFSEVESGIFEAPKPGEGVLFIQNASALGPAPKTAEQVTGDWLLTRRTGKLLCAITLSDTPAGEEFTVRLKPPCDPLVTRFAPATWQMDRGEIVLHAANGQFRRFEEAGDSKWRRIPETAVPIVMSRK
jgi:hypothetical protein